MNSERKWDLQHAIQTAPDSCLWLGGDCKIRHVCSGHLQILHLKRISRLGCWNRRDLIHGWHSKTQRRHASGIKARQRRDIWENSIFLPHTHQTLHRHPRSPPTALCCLTLSGYRCLRTKMASFQLVLWLFHLKCQSKSWNTGGGVVSEGRLSWCSLKTPTVWFAGLSLSEATARREIWRPIDPTCRGRPSQNKSSCEDRDPPPKPWQKPN